MKCFFNPESDAHAPDFFLARGQVAANEERPERSHRLLAGLEAAGLVVERPDAYPVETLAQVHTTRYLGFLETAWDTWQKLPNPGAEVVPNIHRYGPVQRYPEGIVGRAGWHMADTACPLGQHTWQAARAAADSALAATDAVLNGEKAAYALSRPPGHHAYADCAGGHCFINNAALAAQLLRGTHDRVAVLDIDVHHGNGTQGVFWERPDVLTVSVHADPSSFYPFYCGYEDETGDGDGAGHCLNLPLPRGSEDADWLAAIARGLDRITEFAPGALVVSLGLDAYMHDPLGGLSVSTPGFNAAAGLIAHLDLPTVFVQEGGYLSDDLSRNLTAFLTGWKAATSTPGACP